MSDRPPQIPIDKTAPSDDQLRQISVEEYELEELPFDTDESEEGEGGGRSGKSGEGGGQNPRKYRVMPEKFLDFADDPNLTLEENAERKLRLLAMAPNSQLTIGASAYASENDLSSRIFMVDIGRRTGEAALSDMADPHFIDKRDILQRMRRKLANIAHPSLMLSGLIALGNRFSEKSGFNGTSSKGKNKAKKLANKLAQSLAIAAGKAADRFKSFLDDKESMFSGDTPKEPSTLATPQNIDSRTALSTLQTTDRHNLNKVVVKQIDPLNSLLPLQKTSPLPLTAVTRGISERLPPILKQILGRLPASFRQVTDDRRTCEIIKRSAAQPSSNMSQQNRSDLLSKPAATLPVSTNITSAKPTGAPITSSSATSPNNPTSNALRGKPMSAATSQVSLPPSSSNLTVKQPNKGQPVTQNLGKPSLLEGMDDIVTIKSTAGKGESEGKKSGEKGLKDIISPNNEIK